MSRVDTTQWRKASDVNSILLIQEGAMGFSRLFRPGAVAMAVFVAVCLCALPARADDPKQAKEKAASSGTKHLWGRRHNESETAYAKRRDALIQRCKKDKLGLFSVRSQLFVVRTDITPEFTADLALYVEELHRAYQSAFSKLGAPAAAGKDLIEVVCYKARSSYIKDGGNENAAGHFEVGANRSSDWNRPKDWPTGTFRLALFTNEIVDFDTWDKQVMKHEAAHMELQLRLGYFVDCPRWWNEGMASCFESWDFDKTVDENFAEIPKRGEYAPFVRKMWGTDRWKDFNYVWTIDGAAWHRDMATPQGRLNYCQAWSLAAFMFNQGPKGKKFFNQIFNRSVRIGADEPDAQGIKKRG